MSVATSLVAVKELMTQEAARTMYEKKIGCLPVVEDGRLAGILTESDVLRYAMIR